MKSEWKNSKDYELGEVCSRLSSGKSISAKEILEFGKYPVYGGNGIRGYTDKKNFSGQCGIIGRQGAFCGNVRYFSGEAYMTEHAVVVCANEQNDTRYLVYMLSQLQLGRLSGQSAQPGLSVKVLAKQKIHLPDFETQKKIAKVLSALDDKIELNNKINKNLEEQAQALYNSWFVDFEPFGRRRPTSWYMGILSDLANISTGKRPTIKSDIKTSEFCIPIVGASSVMGYTSKSNYNDRILVTGRVGTHGVIQRFSTACWASDNTLVITSNYYEYVNQILGKIDYSSLNRGSTQPLITQGDMNKEPVLIPDAETLNRFETIVGALMTSYDYNNNENMRLEEMRDSLLPKLMSGEIDVDNVEI